MQITIRLGEPFWRTVGRRNLEWTLAPGATLADLLDQLCRAFPGLTQELQDAPPHLFVGEDEAAPATPLADGNRVSLLWAVAGGGDGGDW
ncbi:MAG: MoaD/ThiS family protein [Caldilineales bacterium]|nr:MoaD/ThiS family protein [Caldilineales bacterium]MCW5856665.1 MoaD/ThiS family protein [Caldilineales bacterium]